MNKPIGWLQEFSERIGEGTEFAATLTCIPFDDGSEWMGTIKFDNNDLNWPDVFEDSEGGTLTIYSDWHYPGTVPGGTYLNTCLINWHGEIVALIERIRQMSKAVGDE